METIEWLCSNWKILICTGGVILASVGVASFIFRNPWGHWHNGSGVIYKKPKGWDNTHKHYE